MQQSCPCFLSPEKHGGRRGELSPATWRLVDRLSARGVPVVNPEPAQPPYCTPHHRSVSHTRPGQEWALCREGGDWEREEGPSTQFVTKDRGPVCVHPASITPTTQGTLREPLGNLSPRRTCSPMRVGEIGLKTNSDNNSFVFNIKK